MLSWIARPAGRVGHNSRFSLMIDGTVGAMGPEEGDPVRFAQIASLSAGRCGDAIA